MATLKGSTIASTFDSIVKRADTYVQTGTNIELMTDTNATAAPTGLYLESGATTDFVGIGVADPDTALEIFDTTTQLKLSFDATDFCTFGVDTNHDLTITPSSTGQIKLKPTTDSVDFFQVLDAAGTPILNVDSTNERIGIGADDPGTLLEVRGGTGTGATGAGVLTLSTAETTIRVSSVDQLGRIDFQAPKEGGGSDAILVGASIGAVAEEDFSSSNNSTALFFSTGTTTVPIERMRITQDGHVGIGTTDPTYQFELARSGGAEIAMSNGTNEDEEAISDGVMLGQIMFFGYDAQYGVGSLGAFIKAEAAGAFDEDNALDAPTELQFFTQDDGTGTSGFTAPRMVINADGKVGIGVTAPDNLLHVEGTTGIAQIESTTGDTVSSLILKSNTTSGDATASSIRAYNGSSEIGRIAFKRGADADDGEIDFYTANGGLNASAMHIDQNNLVGIGIAVPTSRLHVEANPGDDGTLATFKNTRSSTADASDTILDLIFSGDVSPGGAYYISFQDSNSSNGLITDDDDGTVTFNDGSDYRIKSNIELIDSALSNINKLKPSSFNIRERTKKAHGFIAHELQEVFPNMVTGEKDGMKIDHNVDSPTYGQEIINLQMVAPNKLIPFMVKAIQELSAKVTVLENA